MTIRVSALDGLLYDDTVPRFLHSGNGTVYDRLTKSTLNEASVEAWGCHDEIGDLAPANDPNLDYPGEGAPATPQNQFHLSGHAFTVGIQSGGTTIGYRKGQFGNLVTTGLSTGQEVTELSVDFTEAWITIGAGEQIAGSPASVDLTVPGGGIVTFVWDAAHAHYEAQIDDAEALFQVMLPRVGRIMTITFEPASEVADAPLNTSPPVVSGVAVVGQTLTCTTGVWTGTQPISYAYQWLANGVNIGGALAASYILQANDTGRTVSCRVMATNTAGSVGHTSNGVGPVAGAPANTGAPSITGTPAVGQTLTCAPGTWTGYPAPTFAYQWLRNGSIIVGADQNVHTLTIEDGGANISCRVTATNTQGSAPATATAVGPIRMAPVNTVLPSITGSVQVGSMLVCSTGTWTGSPSPTYGYQWLRDGVSIGGALAQNYVTSDADIGAVMSCRVTATNSTASVTATSGDFGPIEGEASAYPHFMEKWEAYEVGNTFTELDANYGRLGNAAQISIVANDVSLVGKSAQAGSGNNTGNLVHRDDIAVALGVRVDEVVEVLVKFRVLGPGTPRGGFGYMSGVAGLHTGMLTVRTAPNTTVYVQANADPGGITGAVAILSNLQDGDTAFCRYQVDGATIRGKAWKSGNAEPASYVDNVSGAFLTFTQAGLVIRNANPSVEVIAYSLGIGGPAQDVDYVPPPPDSIPVNDVPPVASGQPEVGDLLTTTPGSWSGYPTPVLTYQWLRDGATIGGAAENFYTVQAADIGATLTCRVTGTNSAGSDEVVTNGIGPIASGAGNPVNVIPPDLTGTLFPGGNYSINGGEWTLTPDLTFFLQTSASATGPWDTLAGAVDPEGKFPDATERKYVRAMVMADAKVPAFSNVVGPLGRIYNQIVSFAGSAANYLEAPLDAWWKTLAPTDKFWISAIVFNPGVNLGASSGVAAVGNLAGVPSAGDPMGQAMLTPSESTLRVAGAGTTAVLPIGDYAASAHYLVTGTFWKRISTRSNAAVQVNGDGPATTETNNSGWIDPFNAMRIGQNFGGVTSGNNFPGDLSWVAWGKGDPTAAHAWAFNEGELRNIWDYPGWDADNYVEDFVMLARKSPGSVDFFPSQVPTNKGIVFTQVGANIVWEDRVPGFVDPSGISPPTPAVYIYPMMGLDSEDYTLCSHDDNAGSANPALFTIHKMMTETGVDLSGTVTNGKFRPPGPCIIDCDIEHAVTGRTQFKVYVVREEPLSTDSTFAHQFNGNGRIAAIQPYPVYEAGTQFADGAALQNAINNLPIGGRLIIADMTDLTANIVIPARLFNAGTGLPRALIAAEHRHGVYVNSLNGYDFHGLELRGFKVPPLSRMNFRSNDTFVDQMLAYSVEYKGMDRNTSFGKLGNCPGYDDGKTLGWNVSSWNWFEGLHLAVAGIDPLNFDNIQTNLINYQIWQRCYFGDNLGSVPGAHADLHQSTGNGAQGFRCGLFVNCVALSRVSGNHADQCFFISDGDNRYFRFLRCIGWSQSNNCFVLSKCQQGCGIEECTAGNGSFSMGGGINHSQYIRDSIQASKSGNGDLIIRPAQGNSVGCKQGIDPALVWPNSTADIYSWKMFLNPAPGYETIGAYKLINELIQNEIDHP